jgi:hypothetical protein
MKLGKYKPGEAILRMKQDLDDPNPQMWDLIAYRVLLATHHRTGDKWKVYPTYDFTHCLVDSFENISYVVIKPLTAQRDLSQCRVQSLPMHRRVHRLPPVV